VVDNNVVCDPKDPRRASGRIGRHRPAHDATKYLADEVLRVGEVTHAEPYVTADSRRPGFVEGGGLKGLGADSREGRA
jgi:hypothetical protein